MNFRNVILSFIVVGFMLASTGAAMYQRTKDSMKEMETTTTDDMSTMEPKSEMG